MGIYFWACIWGFWLGFGVVGDKETGTRYQITSMPTSYCPSSKSFYPTRYHQATAQSAFYSVFTTLVRRYTLNVICSCQIDFLDQKQSSMPYFQQYIVRVSPTSITLINCFTCRYVVFLVFLCLPL